MIDCCVLLPGFSARELPGDLANVNNVRYRPDGKLVALGYDGNIHLLSDRDGDGLEERVEPFWENKGAIVALVRSRTPQNKPCTGKTVGPRAELSINSCRLQQSRLFLLSRLAVWLTDWLAG